MKKLLFFALLLSIPIVANISVSTEPIDSQYSDPADITDEDITIDEPVISDYSYPRQQAYPRYYRSDVGPIRATAEGVVEGTERIIEAPLNLLP